MPWRSAQHSHENITLSSSLKALPPGSSCPLPSTPAGSCCCSSAALPLLPDPPSPPPAPSRCLLPVVAISLFCRGCVDTLQKPPTAPTPPQAVSPRSHDHPDHMIIISSSRHISGHMIMGCQLSMFGALCPSKSGPIHKHTVKHIASTSWTRPVTCPRQR